MATHQLSLNECNTPWWYETPSLASQSTFSGNTYCTGTSQIDPFDITPSQSSGYYDEDTTISEASSNLFTSGIGSCATCSEWTRSGADGGDGRTASSGRSVRPGSAPTRPATGGSSPSEGGGSLCEHCAQCGNHGARDRVYHGGPETRHANPSGNPSEVMIAPVSMTTDTTLPLSAFSSSEVSDTGPTPSTCTELNENRDSQDGCDNDQNYDGEWYDYESSVVSDSDYRGSQLSHSMASTNQHIIRELAKELMQHIDSETLFPHLQRNELLSIDDVEYICNPKRTENERRRRIIVTAPSKDHDAFDRFVDCLSIERTHSGHAYLAKRLKEAVKKKRENPFKTMSSLRNKKSSSGRHHSEGDAHSIKKHSSEVQDHQSSSVQSSPKYHQRRVNESESRVSPPGKSQSPRIRETRPTATYYQEHLSPPHMPHRPSSNNSNAPSPMFSPRSFSPPEYETVNDTSARVNTSPAGHLHYSRPSPSGSPGPVNYTYTQPVSVSRHQPDEQGIIASHMYGRDHYESYNQPGGYSSLPRQFSNPNVPMLSRGAPAYSSARYQAEQKRKAAPLNRHGSFHSHNDAQLVSPLTRRTPPRDATMSGHHPSTTGYGYDYHRKYSLPVTSQQSVKSTSQGKSHSGSQLPNVRNSQYPPLREIVNDKRSHNVSATQGEFPKKDGEIVFPTFYSQYMPSENQYAAVQDHHQLQHMEGSSSHQSQNRSPSVGDSRGRHSAMQAEDHLFPSQQPLSDFQGSVEDLLSQERHTLARTHRRSRSCDASKALRDMIVPQPYEEVKSRHQSLIRRRQPTYENVGGGGLVGKETGDAKLIRKKILWLQDRVAFTDFAEELNFLSLTHYHQRRDILYSGTLYEHGKPRFVVLLTDMLLILKPRKKMKMNMVQSKLGVQLPQLDWFSDLGCKTKRPLFLHLMMVQRKLKKYNSECFSIRYNNQSEMVEVTLQAVSKEAKEIWVESLSQAIKSCTEEHANSILPVGNPTRGRHLSGPSSPWLSLGVLQANNLALSTSNCKTRNHYCSIHLGDYKCRTPSVKAKCWPSWTFQCEFSNFDLNEIVQVTFYAERTTCPDDFLGNVEIDLQTLVQSQRCQVQDSDEHLSKCLFKNQVYPLQNGKGTLTFDIELGQAAINNM